MPAWTGSKKFPGVRWRTHATRRHGVQPDRYYAVRYQKEGKRHEEALGWASEGWTETKAGMELAKLRTNATTGDGPSRLKEARAEADKDRLAQEAKEAEARRDAVTFAEFFADEYAPTAQASKTPSSWNAEQGLFHNYLRPVLGNTPLKDINEVAIQKVVSVMTKAGKSARTVEYALATLRQTYNHAITVGAFTGTNPVRVRRHMKGKKLRIDNQRQRFLTVDEARMLLEALQVRSQQLYEIALLSLHTGARFGELAALQWQHVDTAKGIVRFHDGKTGDRGVYMTPAVKDLFEEKTRGKASDLVFPSDTGEPMKQVSATFMKVVNSLGLNDGITDPRMKLVFHSLRHSAASFLVQAGCSIYAVKEMLGHKDVKTTQRYAHLAPDNLAAVAQTLANACDLSGKPRGKVVNLRKKS